MKWNYMMYLSILLLVVESPAHSVAGSEGNVEENKTEICSDVDNEPGNTKDPGSVYFFKIFLVRILKMMITLS